MAQFSLITVNPNQMNGQPCLRGMRLTVRRVLDLVATYDGDLSGLQRDYPELTVEDLREAIRYAAATLDDEVIELRPAS